MKWRAILFDMDGVIVDSEPAHEKAFRETLKSFGILMTPSDYKTYFSGKPGPQAMDSFFSARNIHLDIQQIMATKENCYINHFFRSITDYPDTIEFIKTNNPPLPYGLVTSSIRDIASATLKKYHLDTSFDTIVTLDDVKVGKPNPEGYLLAASNLRIDPASCIVIEDSPNGVKAAKSAGMYCIALTTTHSKSELTEADIIAQELTTELFV